MPQKQSQPENVIWVGVQVIQLFPVSGFCLCLLYRFFLPLQNDWSPSCEHGLFRSWRRVGVKTAKTTVHLRQAIDFAIRPSTVLA